MALQYWHSIEYQEQSALKRFGVNLKVYSRRPQEIECECRLWRGMTLSHLMRWKWFFIYRAALLQIKYPRFEVELSSYSYQLDGRNKEEVLADMRKKRITTCKRMITKISNQLTRYEAEENKKLLPNFENPAYLKAKKKLSNYFRELKELENAKKV